jgi:hypothetical protein
VLTPHAFGGIRIVRMRRASGIGLESCRLLATAAESAQMSYYQTMGPPEELPVTTPAADG